MTAMGVVGLRRLRRELLQVDVVRANRGAPGAAGVCFSAVWQHALKAGLVNPHADPHRLHALRNHWLLVPLFYGAAFALALVTPRLSLGIYLILLFYYGMPGPIIGRGMTMRRARASAARNEFANIRHPSTDWPTARAHQTAYRAEDCR